MRVGSKEDGREGGRPATGLEQGEGEEDWVGRCERSYQVGMGCERDGEEEGRGGGRSVSSTV